MTKTQQSTWYERAHLNMLFFSFGSLLGWRTAVGSGWQWEADNSASRAADSRQDPSGPACSSERRPDPAQLCEIKLTSCCSRLAQLKLLDWLPHSFTGLALCTGAAFLQWRMKGSLDCLVEEGETELNPHHKECLPTGSNINRFLDSITRKTNKLHVG